MSGFFKAELKDKFLHYALDRDDYFEVQLLYDEFLRPNYSLEYVQKLILEVIDDNPDLLDIMSGNGAKVFMLSATDYTSDFLEVGGFKSLYIQEEEKWDDFLEQLSNTPKPTSQDKAYLAKTEKRIQKREKRLLFGLIAALMISFLYTLYSLSVPFFSSTQKGRLTEIERTIINLEKENEKLKKELDSLQFHFNMKSE